MEEQHKIAIYGVGGLYNFGCEAIVRGTVDYLRKRYKQPIITYYTINYLYDKPLIEDLNINVEAIPDNINIFVRFANYIFRKLKLNYQIPYHKYHNMCLENDIFYSIGGDIYTIPKVKREKKTYPYYNEIVHIGEQIVRCNKKLVLFGASIGPFGQYSKAINYYKRHLKKVSKIICREEETYTYLAKLGIKKNLSLLPDPVFLVRSNNNDDVIQEKKYIGVNLSGLSLMEVYDSVENGMSKAIALVNNVLSCTQYDIMLIPHVINTPYNTFDDDHFFLSKIFDELPLEAKKRVVVANPKNFLDVKEYIKKCYAVIAARMHCAVNAITEGIPAIFVAYSQKGIGMCRFVYGDDYYCVNIEDIDSQISVVIKRLFSDYENTKRTLQSKYIEIINSYNENIYVKSINGSNVLS